MAGIQHATMNERVKKEYYRRATLFLKSELNGANKIGAVNTLTVPVITYGFNMIRLYLPRKSDGRGLILLELSYKISAMGLNTYLKSSEDCLPHLVQVHNSKKKLYFIRKEEDKFSQELDSVPDLP